jgi:hypothetical protein
MTRKEIAIVCVFLGTLVLIYSGRQSAALESKSQTSQFVGKIIEVNWNAHDGMFVFTPAYVRDCDVATGMLCLSPFQTDEMHRRFWVHPSALNQIQVITEQEANATIWRQKQANDEFQKRQKND